MSVRDAYSVHNEKVTVHVQWYYMNQYKLYLMRITSIIIVITDKSVPVVSILALPKLIKWTEQVKNPNIKQEETI